jgi:2-iminobutanoate/2-iminopropanoate deaminase
VKIAVESPQAPAPRGPYSQAIMVPPWIFVSGQLPIDPSTGHVPEGIVAQTYQVFRNISAILVAAGAALDDVVRVSAHLADLDLRGEYNRVYEELFSEPYPARITVGSQLGGVLVEVEVTACRNVDSVTA